MYYSEESKHNSPSWPKVSMLNIATPEANGEGDINIARDPGDQVCEEKDLEDKSSEGMEVKTILVSTRGSTEPNPLKKLYSDNQPPTKQEFKNYLHLHPAIKEVEEVQEILQVHYCQYESEEEESSSDEETETQNPRLQEHLDYLHNLPAREKKRVTAAIAKSNEEMSQRVIQEFGRDCIDPVTLERIRKKGAEMHDDLILSDHKNSLRTAIGANDNKNFTKNNFTWEALKPPREGRNKNSQIFRLSISGKMSKKTFFSVLKKHGRDAPFSYMSVKSELPQFLRDFYNRSERTAALIRSENAGMKTRTLYNPRDLAVDLQIGKVGDDDKVEFSTIASSKHQDGLCDIPLTRHCDLKIW